MSVRCPPQQRATLRQHETSRRLAATSTDPADQRDQLLGRCRSLRRRPLSAHGAPRARGFAPKKAVQGTRGRSPLTSASRRRARGLFGCQQGLPTGQRRFYLEQKDGPCGEPWPPALQSSQAACMAALLSAVAWATPPYCITLHTLTAAFSAEDVVGPTVPES